ncbi:hypothetical protein [Kitasatospora sp. NPDC088346]|uniref:hypothetical protein n=1 Tax=Kitasatospora sp. NPDC088346 TaxID=3364073 RepID=UPI0037FD24D0
MTDTAVAPGVATASPSAAAGIGTGTEDRQNRFVSDVMALHDRMNLRGLAASISPDDLLYLARRPDGLVVLAARHRGIPERYLIGIYGFRLAQYLRLRFADESLAFRRALFSEPHGGHRAEEVHVLAMDERTGAILRYVSLVGAPEGDPADLRDPDRTPFPCERAHRINLFDHVAFEEEVTTSEVWEVKRLVHRGPQGGDNGATRLRVTLELMLGFYTALGRIRPGVKVLVGDGEEGVAIQRTLRSLREITVLEGTVPSLPADDLMFPLYTQREVVKAFAARAPRGGELDELIGQLQCALAHEDLLLGFRSMVGQVGGQLRRVTI